MTLGITKVTRGALRVVVVGAGLFGSVTLTGCETLYPTLLKIEVDTSLTTPAQKSSGLLKSAVALRTKYANGFNASSKIVDLSALPILGAAAAAAGLLLFDGSTDAVKAVALGAGTYTAGRLLFVPQGTPELYVNAHRAVSCVIAEGSILATDSGELDTLANNLADEIAKADVLARSAPAGTEEARSNLLAEITNSNEALAKAEAAKGAYQAGPQTIANALQDIQTRVVQKMREGRSISFPSAVSAITSTYQGVAAEKRQDVSVTIEDLQTQTDKLVNSRQKLEAGTPPYAQAQGNVGKCPERI